MASPQKENGYTAISNEILDAMYKHDFGGSKGQVFMSIIRLTYGWNKKKDKISISRICDLTNLSKRNVIYTLQNLEAQQKIIIQRGTEKGFKKINEISIQKDYEKWNDESFAPQYLKVKERAKQSSAKLRSSAKLGEIVVQNSVKNIKSFAHTKDNNKYNITKDKAAEPLDPINFLISIFQTINPGINYSNLTTRKAAQWLINKYGSEKTNDMARYAVQVNGKQFAPTITTPYELKENLGKLITYHKRETNKKGKAVIIS